METPKAKWTAYSISVPLVLGLFAYFLQSWSQRKSERLQFKLKAAEIAMSARDSNQVKAKATILKELFKDDLKGFEPQTDFTPANYPFSQSIESREALLALLAENPHSREEIITAWGIMFPWDKDPFWNKSEAEKATLQKDQKYLWYEKLAADGKVNKNSPGSAVA